MARRRITSMAAKKKPKKKHATTQERAKAVAYICNRLREGGCSLRQACRELDIPVSTAQEWAAKEDGQTGQYARARAEGLAIDVDAIHELARTKCSDQVEAASVRLQVDTLKWDVSKRLPKTYGDRIKHDHDGKVSLTVVTGVPQPSDNSVPVDGE